jgi:hypothetical protein
MKERLNQKVTCLEARGVGGRMEMGQGGEMTQTMYAHVKK